MFKTLLPALSTVLLLLASPSAQALTDYYSTGPGQGGADTLDDVWQSLYNGWGLVPGEDTDLDGCSNYIESIAGTDPRKAGDCLKVGNMVVSGNALIFYFDAEAGKKYRVVAADNPAATTWDLVEGSEKVPTSDSVNESIVIAKPAGDRKFYKLETLDVDTDSDGVSDWAERELGTNVASDSSVTNASGGAATDADTLHSLLSLTATPGPVNSAFEKEGTTATVRLERSFGTMPLTVQVAGEAGAVDSTKGSASSGDYLFKNMADVPTTTVTIPAGQGTPGNPVDVVKVAPVLDADVEVPEAVKVKFILPNTPPGTEGPSATVTVKDADPGDVENRQLYVAFLGREAGVVSTASGYATALVNGDNDSASISLVFSNLSSAQNTAYIRIGSDLEVRVLPLGQVSGANWNIRAAQTKVTDQQMLTALENGELYVSVSSANYPNKEIFGYFNKATGSTAFDPNNDDLLSPGLGSTDWQNPTGEALSRDIYRFLSQCTFGATTALHDEVLNNYVTPAITGGGTYIDGLRNWLNVQMDIAQTPMIDFSTLVMAADNEEFVMRGNRPLHYNSDPQYATNLYPVTYDGNSGMPTIGTTANTTQISNNYPASANNRRREWWSLILQSKDQVRQRMAMALSEILVISEADQTINDRHYGCAEYWDILATGAFDKYRPLLEQVTYSPMMGSYLSHVGNRAMYDAGGGLLVSPDENYAREIMQLFSIGLVLRHPDGSLVLSGDGLPIATYDNTDITELARVMTGWSHGARHTAATVQMWNGDSVSFSNSQQRVSPVLELNASTATWFGIPDGGGHRFFQQSWMQPMKILGRATISSVLTTVHDFNQYTDPATGTPVAGVSKRLLAGKHGQFDIPIRTWTTDAQAHAAAAEDVNDAHNSLAGIAASSTYGNGTQGNPGHQNTPVNISRWLIQRLTSSNPSAGYVYRVQQVYRSTNGDLGEVMKAILLDYEARSLQLADTSASAGKIKEPMIHFANVLRSLKAFSGAPLSLLRDNPPPFSASESMLATAYPASELSKFDTTQANPPSLPTGWATGPFRYRFGDTTSNLGQSPQRAPSVFNWFLPDYTVPGLLAQAGLFAPELQISTESSEVARINYHWSVTWGNLVGMSTQPGTDSNVSDFTLSNAFATPTARFSSATLTFTDANWNVPQNVTVTANNNGILSGLQSGNVQFTLGGTTSTYNGVSVQPLTIGVQDNELRNEGLRIVQTGGSTWVQEGGKTDTFNVMLTAPPMADVTVTMSVGSQVSLSSNTLTFTAGNWNVEQTVTVTAVNDATTEAAGATDTIAFTTSSTAANYNGLTAPSITANVVDNDDGASSYGVLITESGAGTTVTESTATSGGDLDTYTIVLTKQPSATVTVTITCNSQVNVNTTGTTYALSTTRTFSTSTGVAGGWNVPQTITLRGVSETTAEGTHTGTVTHTVATAGGYTAGMAIQGINVTVLDRNDTNGNRLMLAHGGSDSNETRVGEGTGALTDTITVRLRTLPTANVSVNIGSNQVACSPSVLTFTTANWSTPQTVTVSAIDDYLNEGLHSANIIAYSYSTDASYLNYGSTNSNLGALLTTSIIDNDAGRVVVTQSGGSTVISENGTTDSYTLVLSAQPTAPVSIALQPSSQITTTPAGPVVFDSTNWNTPFTVTVAAAFDTSVELTTPAQITHYVTSADLRYHGIETSVVSPVVSDNELPLTIAQTNSFTTVAENGTAGTTGTPNVSDTFVIRLARQPSANVTVTPVFDSQVTVTPVSLTFTNANYNTDQTVTVTALDDGVSEATPHLSTIGFNLVSTDGYYNGIAAQPVIVAVKDNDAPGVSIVESSGTTASTENATDSYTLVLTKQPSTDVVVRVSCDAQTEVLISGSTYGATRDFTFTNASWNTTQTVTIRAKDDTTAELRHLGYVSHSVVAATSDDTFDAVTIPQVVHIITDNDNAVSANKVQIAESSNNTTVTEAGASDTYTVVLSQAPTSDVVVTLSPNSQLMVTPATLTFTSGNYNTAQTVTVRAVDDGLYESSPHYGGLPAASPHYGTIAHSAASTDLAYQGIAIAPVTASITDNDIPGVLVTPSGGSTLLAEAGGNDTYTVALTHEPTADVVVTLTPNAQLDLNGTSALTFTTTGGATPWNVPQTVTLTAVNDGTTENTHTAVLAHTVASTDRRFQGISVPSVSASIVDNDGPQVTISHTSGSTEVTEGGATDTISIVLTQAPAAGTTLTVNLIPPAVIVPVPVYSKQVGYFTSDIGGNQQRERIVMDYTEVILLYRTTFYASLSTQYSGSIPGTPGNTQVQNAHWAATKAIVDRMDLWWCGGSLKAKNPVLIEPNQTPPSPLPSINARQTIMEALYYLGGGSNSPSTTRYLAEITYNPKAPPTGTFHDEVRDRARYAAYLISSVAPSLVAH